MQSILSKYPSEIIEKAKKIKAIVFDVDGVLTDGGIIYDNSGMEYKKFNVKDGQIINYLSKANILCGAVTGRNSDVVKFRCKELKLDFDFHGIKNKLETYESVKSRYNLTDEGIAYIGDDIIDLAILSRVGLAIVPADGLSYVREKAHIITEMAGGKGVVREAADFILAAQGKLEEIVKEIVGNYSN